MVPSISSTELSRHLVRLTEKKILAFTSFVNGGTFAPFSCYGLVMVAYLAQMANLWFETALFVYLTRRISFVK